MYHVLVIYFSCVTDCYCHCACVLLCYGTADHTYWLCCSLWYGELYHSSFLYIYFLLPFQEYCARDGDIYTTGSWCVLLGQYTVSTWFLPWLRHLLAVLCHCWMPVFTSQGMFTVRNWHSHCWLEGAQFCFIHLKKQINQSVLCITDLSRVTKYFESKFMFKI